MDDRGQEAAQDAVSRGASQAKAGGRRCQAEAKVLRTEDRGRVPCAEGKRNEVSCFKKVSENASRISNHSLTRFVVHRLSLGERVDDDEAQGNSFRQSGSGGNQSMTFQLKKVSSYQFFITFFYFYRNNAESEKQCCR